MLQLCMISASLFQESRLCIHLISCYPWIYHLRSLDNAFGRTILSPMTIYSEHDDILCHVNYYLDSKKRSFLLETWAAHFLKSTVSSGRCSSLFLGRIRWAEGSIDRSVGRLSIRPPQFFVGEILLMNFVTVLVSEFYFVSVTDILYGRIRDFYMVLNCVRAQKLNYAAMHNGRTPIERWLLEWSYTPG